MGIRLGTVVAASSLALVVIMAASSSANAIEIGETCPCAQSGGGGGRCTRVVSARTCAIGACGASFKCVPDADSTHMCLAQAGSGQAGKCDGPVSAGQTSCPCTVGAVSGGPPSLVPMQTTPPPATAAVLPPVAALFVHVPALRDRVEDPVRFADFGAALLEAIAATAWS